MIRKGLALFDLDGTVTKGDSILPMIRYAVKTGFASPLCLPGLTLSFTAYALKMKDDTRAKEAALSFLTGKTTAQVAAFADAFCRDVLIKRIFPDARREMENRRAEGLGILAVTASPDFYLMPLMKELPLNAIIGTRADVSPEGIYTGRISGRNCRFLEKPLRIAEYLAAAGIELDTESSYSYGNSGHDWPMMTLAGHPVAVNAKKSLLRRCGTSKRVIWKL